MATERSATRRGTSRRSSGVIRRFTSGDSSGVVGWLTMSGRPPSAGLGTVAPTPAADAGRREVAPRPARSRRRDRLSLERGDQLLAALEPVGRVLHQHALDDLEDPPLVGRDQLRRRNRLGDVLVADGEAVLAVVGHRAGEALIRHHAQAVDVAPAIDGLGPGLLGAHVVRRADGHSGAGELLPGRRLGDPEVGQHALPELVEHDVVGLDVAVDDAALRGVAQRAAGLEQQPADLRRA